MTENKSTQPQTPMGDMLPDEVVRAAWPGVAWPGVARPELFALADILPSGSFGESWVLLLGKELAVVRRGADGMLSAERFTLETGLDVGIVQGIGSSRFRIAREGRLFLEQRFSIRQAKRFSRLLHVAKARAGGDTEPLPQGAEGFDEAERICGKCRRLIPDWADSCPSCLHRRRIFRRLVSFTLKYRWLTFAGTAAAVAGTLLQLVPPKLTKILINDVLTPSPDRNAGLLWPLIACVAALIVMRVLLQKARLWYLSCLSERVTHDIRVAVFDHLQKLSLAYYSRKSTGNLISRITSDTDRLWDFLAFGLTEVMISLITLVGAAVIMFMEDPVLAALTLIPIPMSIIVTAFHIRTMHSILGRLWAKWSNMTSVLSDVIPGARVVKAFTQENRESARFARRSGAVVDDSMAVHSEWTSFWPKLSLMLSAGTLIVWSYAGPRIVGGSFDLGSFVMFLGYVGMFYGPIEHLGMMNRMFQRAITSAHRVFSVLDTPPTIYSRHNAVTSGEFKGSIEFDNVSFSYDGIKRVLQNVSFRVEPGEVVGLAGPSGGGKTTLVNLVSRFYDPVEGRILIDGIDVRNWDVHELRRNIGVVLQEPYLFRGTVAENIAYGNPEATIEEIIEAAKAANAHDFIVGFPDGYDTVLGERGQTVSGGERQRMSIARAILCNPKMLILDEATSSVDSKTEQRIQEAIDRLVKGRTTIAIAHRLSTLRRATRLIILDKGKLVEQGTHEQLMARDGVYAGLHKTQADMHSLFAV